MVLTASDTVAVTLFLVVCLSVFGRKLYLRIRYLFLAKGRERRWDHVPTRVKNFMHEGMLDATIVLLFILGIVTSLLFYNATDVALGTAALPAWKPISSTLVRLAIVPADPTWWHVLWWTHVVLLFTFLAYVPH